MKPYNMKQIWSQFRKLHIWTDDICKTICPEKCTICCQNQAIWVTVPELTKMLRDGTPKPRESGCPFLITDADNYSYCSCYESRPLVCRSFGPKQYVGQDMQILTTTINNTDYSLAGPGVCDLIIDSKVNIEDINNIYKCYSVLSEYGLILIGSCEDKKLQIHLEDICDKLQKNADYQIYCRNGKPNK
jgi:Fe-S-cluster containining protein